MSEWHPMHIELAGLSDDSAAGAVRNHTRSCARCRTVASEYEWLQAELAETLKMVANRANLPRATWCEVQNRVREDRHRETVRVRASVVVSAAMVVCLFLCVPSLIKPAAAAQALQPEVALQPTPIAITEPAGGVGGSRSSWASAPHAGGHTTLQLSNVPSVVPLPTPPDSKS